MTSPQPQPLDQATALTIAIAFVAGAHAGAPHDELAAVSAGIDQEQVDAFRSWLEAADYAVAPAPGRRANDKRTHVRVLDLDRRLPGDRLDGWRLTLRRADRWRVTDLRRVTVEMGA